MTPPDAGQQPGAPARRALVSGASIAGLSTAHWLARTGWQVSVLERSRTFRDGGQNVDVRGAARQVVRDMGIEDAVRAHHTTEQGTAFVDARGRRLAGFPADSPDGLTAELEILRGDLARIIADTLPAGVRVRLGVHIDDVTPLPGGVRVTTSEGVTEEHDLLVIAEGVRSTTRDRVFGDRVQCRDLGVNMVYGTIARTTDDDRWWRWYTTSRARQVTLRPDNVGTIRATLAHLDPHRSITDMDADQRRRHLRRVFDDAGWQAARVLDGFETSDDVYADRLTQIRMPSWSQGRVVVTGDAAWCVTPIGGGGASLALLGGHSLAAFLSRHEPARTQEALAAHEAWMRPFVDEVQDLPPGIPRLAYPRSAPAVALQRTALRVAGSRPVRRLTPRLPRGSRTPRALPAIHLDDRDR